MDIFLIVLICIILILFVILIFSTVIRLNDVTSRLSGDKDVYDGPTGEPIWNGVLPDKVDDYICPRFVYENLIESTEFLPENGRIIGYRISPELVIHSTIEFTNSVNLYDFIDRLGGKLLDTGEIKVFKQNADAISELRIKSGDSPLKIEEFWFKHERGPYVTSMNNDLYCKDLYRFPEIWTTLVLKR